jgi:hypothetical protein
MPNFKITAVLAVAGLALSAPAFAQDAEIQADPETLAQAELIRTPSEEGIVTDAESCEYEGGDVVEFRDGTVCFIRLRDETANTKVYDGMQLGVFQCSGNGEFPNELSETAEGYCNIYLTEKRRLKTREELQAELDAMTEAELEGTN